VIGNKDELSGLPDDALQAAQEAAQEQGKSGWLFTLKAPSYMPIMQYADNRDLREKMYRAYNTRASEFGKAEWDNTPLMDEIVKLRGRRGKAAGLRQFRRTVIGEQDGELAATGGRIHARTVAARTTLCGEGPAPNCANTRAPSWG